MCLCLLIYQERGIVYGMGLAFVPERYGVCNKKSDLVQSDHDGCDRDGFCHGWGADEDRRFCGVAPFGGNRNSGFRRDDSGSFDRSFLSF